jgi:hypothetical protein
VVINASDVTILNLFRIFLVNSKVKKKKKIGLS